MDQNLSNDLTTIMEENHDKFTSLPPDSIQRIFWEQQKEAALFNNSKSMRWHPLVIKWCMYLRHLSGSAYELLRDTGCLKLPSQRTLRDYTYLTSAKVGFSSEVDAQLLKANLKLKKKSVLYFFTKGFLLLQGSLFILLVLLHPTTHKGKSSDCNPKFNNFL